MEFTDKQRHILEVAEQLIADNGFEGTSIRDISKVANINIAMISYYFGSKEKLLEALFEMRGKEVTLRLENLIQDTTLSSIEKIYSIIDSYVDKIVTQQCFHRIMMRQQATDNGFIAGKIFETKKRNHELIQQLIKHGQKQGDFRKNIDLQLLMVTLFGTVNQMVNSQSFYRKLNNLEDMPNEEFEKQLRKKLSQHLKSLFKALLLTYED
jgi:AcrR family transcriptional regulator